MWQDESRDDRHDRPYGSYGAASLLIGVLIHAGTGVLVFALPPGGSLGAWLAYIGLGLVGLVHLLLGALATRSGLPPIAVTADFEGDDIPWLSKCCPRCSAELAEAIAKGQRRCPACNAHFTTRELGWRADDHAGEPARLAPDEVRVSGQRLVVGLTVLAVAAIVIAAALGVLWPTPLPTP